MDKGTKATLLTKMLKAENLLAEASLILDELCTENEAWAEGIDTLVDTHDDAYGAMCALANLRIDLDKV